MLVDLGTTVPRAGRACCCCMDVSMKTSQLDGAHVPFATETEGDLFARRALLLRVGRGRSHIGRHRCGVGVGGVEERCRSGDEICAAPCGDVSTPDDAPR